MLISFTNKIYTGKEQGRMEGRRYIGCARRKGIYSGRPGMYNVHVPYSKLFQRQSYFTVQFQNS
jgi:hypothetical protein